jgi:hypothetical protein
MGRAPRLRRGRRARWDPAALGTVEPDDQAAIRFDWSPGTAVIESAYPIVRIWTIHQPGYDGEFSVDWDVADTALVARDGFAVTVAALRAGDAAFIRASLAGASARRRRRRALQPTPISTSAPCSAAPSARLICGFTL